MASKAENKKTATTGEFFRNVGDAVLAVAIGALVIDAVFDV